VSFELDFDDIILDAALARGHSLPHQCRGASCGTCKAEVLEGAVDHGWSFGLALSDAEKAAGLCLLCQSRPRSGQLRLRCINAQVQEVHEVPARVIALSHESNNVARLSLLTEQAFAYRAGNYAELVLPGVSPNRSYSFATTPDEHIHSFYIARHADGRASRLVHDQLRPGDEITLRGPFGGFGFAQTPSQPLLACAGGTGIAPILSLLETWLRGSHAAPAHLLFSVRGPADLFALDRLERLRRVSATFRYDITYTRAPADAIAARSGRLPSLLPQMFAGLAGHVALVAGAPGFVDATVAALSDLGLSAAEISVDRFHPAV
jgi:CDP-4-dehydro-6-deoxyglucose reductase